MGIYIALGSNLGNKQKNIEMSLARLELHGVRIVQVSPLIATEPYGVTDQPSFLNGTAEVETALSPIELLDILLQVEQDMGRQRLRHWGERNIDLDLLLYGSQIIDTPRLTLPHPDMHNRSFVLEPLSCIAPSVIHPLLHQTIGELWEAWQKKQAAARL